MHRISRWILLFAILSPVMIILPVLLRIPFSAYPLISYQDALDFLTPLVLLPIYWLLFVQAAKHEPSLVEQMAFVLLAALWVEGQAIHLAANSISNLIEALAGSKQLDVTGTDIFQLTYFFDEHVGHTIWHFGLMGLAALLLTREWRHPSGSATQWLVTSISGFIYGLTLFIITVEGQTVPLGLPFSVLVGIWGISRGRKILAERPLLAFFLVSCLLAMLLYTIWGVWWGGFPGFFEVGIIK